MALDVDNPPTSCCSVPAFDDGVPIPDEISPVYGDDAPVPLEGSSAPGDDAPALGEDTPVPLDDAPAVVGDLSSRKGHSRVAVVCPGSAHVGAPSRQQCLVQMCRYSVVAGLAAWGLSCIPSAPGSAHRLGSAP